MSAAPPAGEFRGDDGNESTPALSRRVGLTLPISALLLSIVLSVLCYVTLGPRLGLTFAGFVIVSLVAPPLAAGDASRANWRAGAIVGAMVLLPILGAWSWATATGAWSTAALAWLAALVLSYMASVSVTTIILGRVVPSAVAGGVVTLLAIAWLSWPVWTAPWVTGAWANRLVVAHPLFAANVVTGVSPWPQHAVLYNLTRLGQDVSYSMPPSAWGAIMLHSFIAVAGAAPLLRKRRS